MMTENRDLSERTDRHFSPQAGVEKKKGRVFRNTLWLTGSLAVGRGLSYLGFILLARMYSEQEVGIWAVLLTACLFAEILSNLGLDKIVVRDIIRSEADDAELLLSSTLLVKLVFSLVVAVAAYTAIITWYPEIAAGYSLSVGVYLCVVPCIAVTRTLEAWHTARERMHIPALAQVLERFSLLFVIILCWLMRADFTVFLIAGALAPVMRCLVALKGVLAHIRPPGFGKYKSLLKEALLLFAVEAVAGVYLRVDILLVSRMQSLEAAAQYNAAFRMFEVFTVLFAGYLTAIFPSLVKRTRFATLRGTFLLGLCAMVCAAFLGIISRKFLLGLFGPSYLAAADAFTALMLTLPLCYGTSFFTNYLIASGRIPLLLRMSIVVVSSNVLLNLTLIPRLSITGAGMAFLISEVISCIFMALVMYYFIKRDRQVMHA